MATLALHGITDSVSKWLTKALMRSRATALQVGETGSVGRPMKAANWLTRSTNQDNQSFELFDCYPYCY
jgi:hypothetical protein